MSANAQYLMETAPGLFPWMSTNPDISAQSHAPMPLLTTQNSPFLYQVNDPEPVKRRAYCARLDVDRQNANRLDMALWPFLNTEGAVSPSQLRFQLFSSIAYGAQGVWYFHWHANVWDGRAEAPAALYDATREANHFAARMGERTLGCRSPGAYHVAGAEDAPDGALLAGKGQGVERMTDGLLAGVLIEEKAFRAGETRPTHIVVVDERTVPPGQAEPPVREVRVKLGIAAPAARVLTETGDEVRSLTPGGRVVLELPAGGAALITPLW
jgi:hypothetical protein